MQLEPSTAGVRGQAMALSLSIAAAQVIAPAAVMCAAPYLCVLLYGSARGKGISKKLVLRQANRMVVRRLAARAMVGIPVYGLYAGVCSLGRDRGRAAEATEAGSAQAAGLYRAAMACTAFDIAAQTGIVAGLVATHCAGVCGLEALMAAADSTSLTAAAMTCLTGLLADKAFEAPQLSSAQTVSPPRDAAQTASSSTKPEAAGKAA